MHILHVVGARPNFVKAAPVLQALTTYPNIRQTLVHTGQHYNTNMSDVFFRQLALPAPDVNLGVGSGSHAAQTAQIMVRLEEVVRDRNPDRVLVYGDVNSTLAAAIVCAKLGTPVDHIEAGLRSRDRTMPEEINRLVTDQVASLLFTPSPDCNENLVREGVDTNRIHFVGNVMIDTLVRLRPRAEAEWAGSHWDQWRDVPYVLLTLHRPSNVDDPTMLRQIVQVLYEISTFVPILFPVHPRTRSRIENLLLAKDTSRHGRLVLMQPLGYLEFLALQQHATAVITDSGGIQEETTYLGIPCLTLRETTERPITLTVGTNCLIGRDMDALRCNVHAILQGQYRRGAVPPLWDGEAAQRIASILTES
ncbi:MAG: UDP-N-acetylglucosamine 2-epimerase (non-hydrolyzing) [Caldilineaceae bacterium]